MMVYVLYSHSQPSKPSLSFALISVIMILIASHYMCHAYPQMVSCSRAVVRSQGIRPRSGPVVSTQCEVCGVDVQLWSTQCEVCGCICSSGALSVRCVG